MSIFEQLLIICPLVFFGGLVDSIAGGGGIITLPAYYIAGVPPHMALGTNKLASAFGTLTSSAKYIRSKKVNFYAAAVAVPAALLGSGLGAYLALILDEIFLRYILIVALPILAVFVLTNKKIKNDDQGKEPLPLKKLMPLSALAGLVIGGYDGFFGPGTGTFLILIFNVLLGLELLTASGTAKVVNLASNLAAVFTFLFNGSIIFALGIPAVIFSMAGNYIGANIALKNGAKAIRPMFVVVFVLLLVKIIYDILIA